ncbi:hypothetical protein DNK47_02555 [Mycoplasma wenyonii]|uniref:Uncharacterized protein n=1 Tax=Mycoplasma wenyonii TaxID=65123 RepID=A0A328PTT0_9MOLU|nr:hypothetical protein [Mycoplasma wenyonii]RAO94891.1 hypothetical protein DNK47_02555 [Mycoplasma wenyonii]
MLLLTLGKILTFLIIGGGALSTYHFTNRKKSFISSLRTYSGLAGWNNDCVAPFIMKASGGVELNVENEEEGKKLLNEHHQGQGTIEKCPSYKSSK